MTSRERIKKAISHIEPDQVPIDIGGGPTTGMHASLVYQVRKALGLPEKPIKIIDCFQMLGEVDDELAKHLEVDTVKMLDYESIYGFRMENWKPWTLFDGTPVLVPEKFNTVPEEKGDIFNYPNGDKTLKPSARMTNGGYYFDAVIRQHEIDEDHLNVEDNLEEFTLYSDEYLKYTQENVDYLYTNTDKAILGVAGGTALGDIALVPGINLEDPKGIRDIEEWYMSILIRTDYIKEIFDKQSDIAIENLKMYKQAVGEKIVALYLCGNDFGTQHAPFCSVDVFKDVYMSYYKKMTAWIHKNTDWKVFKHSCGAIEPLIDSFIEAGFDILNPVQCSAANMDAAMLKQKYGDRITLWGGGVDTQETLPFGSAEDVKQQVRERIEIFKSNGGYVFNTIHNAQAEVPVENFLAMMETFKQHRKYD